MVTAGGGGTVLYSPCVCVCVRVHVCVCVAKSGRSTASITTAGTVGGPYVLTRSSSFIAQNAHSHLLAKKNSALTAAENSQYIASVVFFCTVLTHILLACRHVVL